MSLSVCCSLCTPPATPSMAFWGENHIANKYSRTAVIVKHGIDSDSSVNIGMIRKKTGTIDCEIHVYMNYSISYPGNFTIV